MVLDINCIGGGGSIIKLWNSLQYDIMESESTNRFKTSNSEGKIMRWRVSVEK